MKINLLKKALAFTIVLSMIMSTFVMVDAATIGSTTWSKDFEGMDNASYNSWLNPADTTLDCSFNGATTAVLSITDDTDPAHGKVMKIVEDPSDTNNDRFVMFTIPKISSGKFMFEFDAKTLGPLMHFTANETDNNGWNQVITMQDNNIICNGTTISTYSLNEWKTFRILFDVDKQQITAYVDGVSATKKSTYATTQAMKFIVRQGEGGVSFDNFKLYPVSGETATMNVLTDGEVRGNFVDYDASDLTLAIGDSYFASLPEITMTNLGDDVISDADDEEMSINAVYNNGNINVTLNDYLNEGSKYRISIPEGTTDMFGRVIGNTNLEFYAAADNGWVTTKSYEEDFDVESVSTDAKPGTSGAVGWVQKGTIELLQDSSYSAGKAIKLGGATQFELSNFGGFMKKGRVHLETKVDMGMGTYFKYDTGQYAAINLFFGQKAVDLTGDGATDESINFQYQAPSGTPNTLWDKRKLKEKELEVIDYTLDIDNLTSYITYNGESFTLDAPRVISTSADLVNLGFQNIRIFQNGAADPMIIDYINWSHEYLPATVKEIKFVDDYDEESVYTTATPVKPTTNIAIVFTEPMSAESLTGITVNDGEADVEYTGSYDSDTNTYTIDFDSALSAHSEYTVTIPDTVADATGLAGFGVSGTFMTGEAVAEEDVKVSDIVYDSTTKTAYVNVTAKAAIDGGVACFATSDSTGVLTAAKTVEIPAMAKGESKTVSAEFSNPKNGEEIRFFFFNNIFAPYCMPKTGTIEDFELVDFTVQVEEGRDIKVMQITDPQIIDSSQCRTEDRLGESSMIAWADGTQEDNCYKYIRQAVETYQPDLILVTGDFVYGEFDDNGSNHQKLTEFFDTLQTPWAPIFGNHELESKMGVEWLCDVFEQSEYCLFKQRELTGNGNYSVAVEQGGEVKRVFFLLDSNGTGAMSAESFANGHSQKTYGFGADQIEWYTKQMKALKIAYPEAKLSAAFHAPLAAFDDILAQYGTAPIDLDAKEQAAANGDYGYIYSASSTWDAGKTVYNGLKKLGVDSMFVGHIHRNNGSFSKDGMRIVYGLKSSTYDSYNYLDADGKVTTVAENGAAPYVGGTAIDVSSEDGSLTDVYHVVYEEPTTE